MKFIVNPGHGTNCNELRGIMARSTRNSKCNHTVDYYLLNYWSGLCRQHYIHLIWFQIYGPGDPNPHGRVLWSLPVKVSDFAPRSHHTGEAGLPKLDSGPAPDSLGLGLSPVIHPKVHGRVPLANPFTIRPFSGVPHYYWDVGRPGRVSGSIP